MNFKRMVLFGVFFVSLNLAAWQKDGVPIVTGTGDQTEPKAMEWADDFVVVYKNWDPNVGPKLRAVIVNEKTGEKLWDVSVVDDNSSQDAHQTVIDKNGMSWIVFERLVAYPPIIGLQKVNSNGEKIFGNDGINISPDPKKKKTPHLCLDGSGEGCYITWTDYRSGSTDVWAARVSVEGQVAWEKRIATSGRPIGIVASGNNAIILKGWDEGRILKIDSMGNFLWDSTGVSISDGLIGIQAGVSDRRKGVIVFFQDEASSLCVQRIDSAGVRRWGNNGVVLQTWPFGSGSFDSQLFPASDFGFSEDGYGGCLVSSYRGFPTKHLVYRVDSSGINTWPSGVDVWLYPGGDIGCSTYSYITCDGLGGGIAVWSVHADSTRGYPGDIVVQRVDATGQVRFQTNGLYLCSDSADQRNPAITSVPGGAIVCWEDMRNGSKDIYAQFIDTLGTVAIEERHQIPPAVKLLSSNPNPFVKETHISYSIPKASWMKLEIFDVTGKRVRSLGGRFQEAGIYHYIWDRKNDSREILPAGIYFCELSLENHTITNKLVVLRK